jgi:hypothetical protein
MQCKREMESKKTRLAIPKLFSLQVKYSFICFVCFICVLFVFRCFLCCAVSVIGHMVVDLAH